MTKIKKQRKNKKIRLIFFAFKSKTRKANFKKIKLYPFYKESNSINKFIKSLPKIVLPKYSIVTLLENENKKILFGETPK